MIFDDKYLKKKKRKFLEIIQFVYFQWQLPGMAKDIRMASVSIIGRFDCIMTLNLRLNRFRDCMLSSFIQKYHVATNDMFRISGINKWIEQQGAYYKRQFQKVAPKNWFKTILAAARIQDLNTQKLLDRFILSIFSYTTDFYTKTHN